MIKTGQLYLISAPSGAGKTSMVSKLIEQDSNIKLAVSHTTRKPRKSEADGKHYYFVSKKKFEKMVINQEFLEYADVYDNLYGTSKQEIEKSLKKGFDVILEIDWQGARQVARLMPESVSVSIAPPSVVDLRNRLEARGSDSQEVIENRMQQVKQELAYLKDSKYVIINDNFSNAVNKLQAIFISQRQSFKSQEPDLIKLGLIGK